MWDISTNSTTGTFRKNDDDFNDNVSQKYKLGSLRNDHAEGNDDATYKTIGLVSKNNGSTSSARAFYILIYFFVFIS